MLGSKVREKLKIFSISDEIVQRKWTGLEADNSQGPDNPHLRVLEEVVPETVDALVVIFQNSLVSGAVPKVGGWQV